MNKESEIIHRMFLLIHDLKKGFRDFLKPHGLTEMEAKIIFSIAHGSIKTSELIHYFKRHKSTIRQKTRSLEEKGYIDIDTAVHDKRERIISLTKKGTVFRTEFKTLEKTFYQTLFQGLSDRDKQQLLNLLLTLDSNYYDNIHA